MNNDGHNITCYWGSGSAPSWRVIICIYEKQLSQAKLEQLSMGDKEHKSPKILALNPRGQAPTFTDGTIVINESLAICQYLAETYHDQGTQLIPNEKTERAIMLQRVHEIENIYGKVINLAGYYWKRKPHYTDAIIQQKKEAFYKELQLWESYIQNGHLVGNQFSLADACFYPVVAFMVRLGFAISQLKNLNEFYEINSKRESILNSWPPHWKESKNKTIFSNLVL